ncbi:M12 family metallopeptidase, partial [Dyadobacter sp. CY326]|uniref:M12 family metallopeptidase n=1 Tax=Dyadobacter sp. CY326 TaxID=2907300 RepID=UPI001F44B6D8
MKTNQLSLWATVIILGSSLLSSCEDKLGETTPGKQTDIVSSDSTGVYKDGMLNGTPIRYKVINGRAVWQGDIVLTPEQLGQGTDPNARISGSGASNLIYRWPNGVIPYEIAPEVDPALNITIKDAIAYWQFKTSITLVPRTNQVDYVRFVIGDESLSEIGKIGNMQEIKLTKYASRRDVIHEIGHTIGLLHEHTRDDRDKWITVKWENVNEEGKEELKTYGTRYPGYPTFGNGPLDYKSVMIYAATSYSKNGNPTMVRKDNLQIWALEDQLSERDANTVEQMYANLYIVWSNNLYSASSKTGNYVNLGLGWKGAAKGIAEQGRYIWAVHGGTLWRIDRFTKERLAMGNED